jgi:hypothetical protein
MARTKTRNKKTAVVVGYGDALPQAFAGFDVVVAGFYPPEAKIPSGTVAIAAWRRPASLVDLASPSTPGTASPASKNSS